MLAGGLALAALAPLALVLLRPARARGRREADLALYRAQLAELERERATGRLADDAHAAARLEVQRRILAVPEAEAGAPAGPGSALLLAALVGLIPASALGLYLLRGIPDMPSAPYAARQAEEQRAEALVMQLRERLRGLDPQSESAFQGWVLLGNTQRARGLFDEAAVAWATALRLRFEPGLAGDLAEMEIERGEAEGAKTLLARALAQQPRDPRLRFLDGLADARAGRAEAARSAWVALLADSPPNAPWRELVQERLSRLP